MSELPAPPFLCVPAHDVSVRGAARTRAARGEMVRCYPPRPSHTVPRHDLRKVRVHVQRPRGGGGSRGPKGQPPQLEGPSPGGLSRRAHFRYLGSGGGGGAWSLPWSSGWRPSPRCLPSWPGGPEGGFLQLCWDWSLLFCSEQGGAPPGPLLLLLKILRGTGQELESRCEALAEQWGCSCLCLPRPVSGHPCWFVLLFVPWCARLPTSGLGHTGGLSASRPVQSLAHEHIGPGVFAKWMVPCFSAGNTGLPSSICSGLGVKPGDQGLVKGPLPTSQAAGPVPEVLSLYWLGGGSGSRVGPAHCKKGT